MVRHSQSSVTTCWQRKHALAHVGNCAHHQHIAHHSVFDLRIYIQASPQCCTSCATAPSALSPSPSRSKTHRSVWQSQMMKPNTTHATLPQPQHTPHANKDNIKILRPRFSCCSAASLPSGSDRTLASQAQSGSPFRVMSNNDINGVSFIYLFIYLTIYDVPSC